jgi:glycerophosphoryl diester phosphodiesterase
VHRLLRIGHRGAAGHAPENTLAAIQKGIDLGVDLVEIDLRRTADGALVVLHDGTVNRTTDGKGRVNRLTLKKVRQFNAGNGEQVPTFEEVLKVASGKVGLMVELKITGAGQQVVETIRNSRFKKPVLYASFLPEVLSEVRTVDAAASLLMLFGRVPRAPVARALEYGASHVGLRHDRTTGRLVDSFHQAGLRVFVYTANHPRDIQHAISIGVDGVISNFPDRIVAR